MKHRLDDAGETGGALSVAAAVEAISGGAAGGLHNYYPHHQHPHLLHQQQPQPVDPGHMPVDQTRGSIAQTTTTTATTERVNKLPGGLSPPSVSGPHRKVSRLDATSDKDASYLPKQKQQHMSRGDGHIRPPPSFPGATGSASTTTTINNNSSSSSNNISKGSGAKGSGGLDRHGVREESPKRVDFSRAHQLREVKWDGTYQDSLAFPSTLATNSTDSTLTNSRDIRETDIRFLNFSKAPNGPQEIAPSPSPYAPPPSLSGSASSFSVHLPSSSSSSSSSVGTSPPVSSATPSALSSSTSVHSHHHHHRPQHNNHHHHHHHHHQSHQHHHHPSHNDIGPQSRTRLQPDTDVRWTLDDPLTSSSSAWRAGGTGQGCAAPASSGQAPLGPKLTRVEVRTVGGGGVGGVSASGSSWSEGSSSQRQPPPEFLLPGVRRQVEEKWASRTSRSRSSRDAAGEGRAAFPSATSGGEGAVGMEDWRGSGDHGGGDRGLDMRQGLSLVDTPSPKRPLAIKKPITVDLKDNEIMRKLKERLKQQRSLAASSQSGSNDTSLVESNSSESSSAPPSIPPRQPLTSSASGGALPKTRKVAAAHPSPSYRGFSDTSRGTTAATKTSTSGGKASGKKKSGAGAKKSLQLQPKRHDPEGTKSISHYDMAVIPPERHKKASRVVASSSSNTIGDKKHSKYGAKDIITTSSWRAGQELILRELGLGKVKAKGPQGESHASNDRDSGEDKDLAACNREPDGAEAGNCAAAAVSRNVGQSEEGLARRDPVTEEVMAKAKMLSEDARNMLHELQLGPEITGSEAKLKSSNFRPPVKRKAPKVVEPDKQQPREKNRHYDPDSVRKFMARQKADRLKRQQEEKEAYQKANERRETCMKELAVRQKKQARVSARMPKKAEEERRKRREEEGVDNKENIAMEVDIDDDSTLTEDSEDDSTPQITPRQGNSDQVQARNGREFESIPMEQGASSSVSGNFIEFQGQRLNVDKDNVLNRFSQIVNQRRNMQDNQGQATNGFQLHDSNMLLSNTHTLPGEETAFAVGSVNAVAKTNEERKQAIRATALTLQSRLAEEARKLGGIELSKKPKADTEFVSGYNRIAGNTSDFVVFESNLPGTNTQDMDREQQAASRIQAAYRGHNVRQALNWELPSGHTFGQRIRGSTQGEEYPNRPDNDNEEASQLSDSSTFSEITATEPSDGLGLQASAPTNKKSHHASHKHKATDSQPIRNHASAGGRVPSHLADWNTTQADPYSVMSIFSRQSKYRVSGPSKNNESPSQHPVTYPDQSIPASSHINTMPSTTDAFVASLNLTSLKQPVITSEERIVVGQSSSGQPVVARARYTRLETTVSEHVPDDDDVDGDRKEEGDGNDSEDSISAHRNHSSGQEQPIRQHVISPSLSYEEMEPFKLGASHHDTFSLESDEEVSENKIEHSTNKKSAAASYVRQISDAGQETDVSQMSEDEPRSARTKKHEGHPSSAHQARSAATAGLQAEASGPQPSAKMGRLSPNSLGNKMSASLNYLESVEESLRQTVGMERIRAVSLAQQESVSLAQVLKARQQEHSAELRQLQLQAQQEALESQKQLDMTRKGQSVSVASLLEKEDNRRPESRSNQLSLSHSSVSHRNKSKSDLSQSAGNRRINRTSASASFASVTQVSSGTTRSHGTVASTSVKTAEDSYNDSDSSIKTASDAEARDSRPASVAEEIQEEESYSMSFDESFTDEESFRQVLPSESHRKELRRQSSGHSIQHSSEVSSHLTPYGDLSSLFAGDHSFNRFTGDMVRQIMREEEYRAQHQAALLSLREKALREKAKAELAWLDQLKKQPRDKRADDMFPNLEKKEKRIRKNLQVQQEEIRKLQEANKMASMERQKLLQQHEQIAKIKENTQSTLQKLQSTKIKAEGRPPRLQDHAEDEIEEASDASEDIKEGAKSDSEMPHDKMSSQQVLDKEEQQMEKIQKLRLDLKYMTTRQQMLHDRKKHAKEMLEWKKQLDEEEKKVYHLEKKAINAWNDEKREAVGRHAAGTDNRKDEPKPAKKVTAVPASKKDDSNVISDHMLSSLHDELAAEGKHRTQVTATSISEVVSTQISASKSDASTEKKSRSRSDHSDKKSAAKKPTQSPIASGSESSIPEEVPSGSQRDEKHRAQDSSDDTIINSSVNEDYADTFEQEGSASFSGRKKLPVGKLLPQGNSPLPSPWSRKAGSESESEDSISHTETLSDASDYEVRVRQLSDELRRRRKEVEILKKERSRRQKDKLKAQEEALKKQLEAYNNYIQQLKSDKDSLEQDAAASAKSAVRPQIKQPKSGHVKTKTSRRGDESNQSSSFEDMRDSTDSNQTSPSIDSKELRLTPTDVKEKSKIPVSLMDRISEKSESSSEKSKPLSRPEKENVPPKASKVDDNSEQTSSSSIAEVVEDISQLESFISDKTNSAALKIQTSSIPVAKSRKTSESAKDEDASYSMDFSENTATLAQSHNKRSFAPDAATASRGKSEMDISEHIEEASVESARSPPLSQHLKFGSGEKSENVASPEMLVNLSPQTMGIQESDSETESRVNSYHTSAKSEGSSRPSSERSVGSMSYSAEDDDEEEDIVSCSSDKTPVKGSPTKLLPPVSPAPAPTEEEISEHISASLPSISEKRQHSGSLRQDSQEVLNNLLGYTAGEEDEDDKTPVPTPREMALSPEIEKEEEEEDEKEEEEEENASLLMTDPLADFHIGDRVLVWGRKMGTLRFKGKVDFSPGIWAGVELDDCDGDSDGLHEGKRYFTCPSGCGVMVHGSDISTEGEKETADTIIPKSLDIQSPDESLTTDQEDSNVGENLDAIDGDRNFLNAMDKSMLHSTPISSPHAKGSDGQTQKPDATPVKNVDSVTADAITDHLIGSILEDTVETMGKIASKKSPPPTLPKPKTPPATTTPNSIEEDNKSTDPSLKKASAAEQATDGVMKSLLNEAISHMMSIKRRQAELAKTSESKGTALDTPLVNGDMDEGLLTKTQKTSVQAAKDVPYSLSRDLGGGDSKGTEDKTGESATSVDPFQRPGSPIPGDAPTAQDHQELNDDLAGLLGEYIEDDFGLEAATPSGKSPPPYPGEGEAAMPSGKESIPEDIPPVVPHTKEEIAPIVAQVVEIFWTHRRYGELLDEVQPPEDYLCGDEDKNQDLLVIKSRRSWRRMLFDLAREVIQEIYKDEDKPDTPAWQRTQHSRQKYFKGSTLPTTIDALQPVVEAAIFDLMDLNGSRKNNTVNKWNIRKKKDAVDAVLVHELGEEEKGWVDYNHDELNLKMNLTNSLFDSLLQDTVQTLNGIYQRKGHSHV